MPPANFLALFGGDDDGAIGAGVLFGWTAAGNRPEFKLVTGISTGALLAPFAFLGPKYDSVLRAVYINSTPKDILEPRGFSAALFDDAMADNGPLGRLVSKYVNEDLLKESAAEYAKGPLVLYNGNRRWDAPVDVADFVVPMPAGLETYHPRLKYFLLDEGRYAYSELAPVKNLAAALFRLENSRTPQDVEQVLAALATWLLAPEQTSLRRAFTVWLKRVFFPGKLPGVVWAASTICKRCRACWQNESPCGRKDGNAKAGRKVKLRYYCGN